jgi:hypothetical protein
MAGASSNGSVEVGGDQNTYRSRALAVSLPGLVAAPAVPGECRIHTRGWGGFSVGATGGTKLDATCMAHQHCLALADRYAAWGRVDAAAAQLETCGGVHVEATGKEDLQVEPSAAPVDYVTRDELAEHERRIVAAGVAK